MVFHPQTAHREDRRDRQRVPGFAWLQAAGAAAFLAVFHCFVVLYYCNNYL
jgi:hypothetical protein